MLNLPGLAPGESESSDQRGQKYSFISMHHIRQLHLEVTPRGNSIRGWEVCVLSLNPNAVMTCSKYVLHDVAPEPFHSTYCGGHRRESITAPEDDGLPAKLLPGLDIHELILQAKQLRRPLKGNLRTILTIF